jgi:hypothetical protein
MAMRLLPLLLLCLSALPVAAQAPPSVSARWLTPTTAEVAWSGPGGPGVCLVKDHPAYGAVFLACEASGALVLRRGGDYAYVPREGDRFFLWSGTQILAEAILGEPPKYIQRLPIIITSTS